MMPIPFLPGRESTAPAPMSGQDAHRQMRRARGFTLLDDALAWGAGAVDEVLFGVPEAIARSIAPEDVERYIRENESEYRGGELAGTIGGAFIPLGGLAGRGLQALGRGAGAGRVGQALSGAGRFLAGTGRAPASLGSAIAQSAGRGALEGGAEAAIRAAANDRDVLSEGLAGAGFGALGGGLGGTLRRPGEAISELRKVTRNADLANMGVNARELRRGLMASTRGSSGNRIGRVENFLDDVSDVGREAGLRPAIGRDDRIAELYQRNRAGYNRLGQLYDEAAPDLLGATLQRTADEGMDLIGTYGQAAVNAARKRLEKIAGAGSTLVNKREALNRLIDAGQRGASDVDSALYDMARTMRQTLDDQVDAVAQASGDATLRQLGKQWKAQEVFGGSEIRSMLTPPRPGTGSPTFDKAMVGGLLGLGTAGTRDWSDPNKIAENLALIAASSVGGSLLSRTLGSATSRLIGSGDDLLRAATRDPRIAQQINQVAGLIAPVAEGAGRVAAPALAANQTLTQTNQAIEDQYGPNALAPAPQQQAGQIAQAAAEVETEGTPEAENQFRSLITQKLRERFETMYPDYVQNESAWNQFMVGAEQASGGFQPRRVAGLLFPNATEREEFTRALDVTEALNANLPTVAGAQRGLFGLGGPEYTPEQEGARATLEGAFVQAATAAKLEPADARRLFDAIISAPGSAAQKRTSILNQIRRWNAGGLDRLAAVGLS